MDEWLAICRGVSEDGSVENDGIKSCSMCSILTSLLVDSSEGELFPGMGTGAGAAAVAILNETLLDGGVTTRRGCAC